MKITDLPRGHVRGHSDNLVDVIDDGQPVLCILHFEPAEWRRLSTFARHMGRAPADVIRAQLLPAIGHDDAEPVSRPTGKGEAPPTGKGAIGAA